MNPLEVLNEIEEQIKQREQKINSGVFDKLPSTLSYLEGTLDSLKYTKYLIQSKLNNADLIVSIEKEG